MPPKKKTSPRSKRVKKKKAAAAAAKEDDGPFSSGPCPKEYVEIQPDQPSAAELEIWKFRMCRGFCPNCGNQTHDRVRQGLQWKWKGLTVPGYADRGICTHPSCTPLFRSYLQQFRDDDTWGVEVVPLTDDEEDDAEQTDDDDDDDDDDKDDEGEDELDEMNRLAKEMSPEVAGMCITVIDDRKKAATTLENVQAQLSQITQEINQLSDPDQKRGVLDTKLTEVQQGFAKCQQMLQKAKSDAHSVNKTLRQLVLDRADFREIMVEQKSMQDDQGQNLAAVRLKARDTVETIVTRMSERQNDPSTQLDGCVALAKKFRNLAYEKNHTGTDDGCVCAVLQAMRLCPTYALVMHEGFQALTKLSWNKNNRKLIVHEGGIDVIVRGMNRHRLFPNLLQTACSLLDMLADDNETLEMIGEMAVEKVELTREYYPHIESARKFLDRLSLVRRSNPKSEPNQLLQGG